MAKRKNSESFQNSGHSCAWSGCNDPGNFRAPRSKQSLREFQWFCAEHIREFNKQWNYFEGMTESEIYEFQKEATTGHRPTWRIDQQARMLDQKMEEAFARMFGQSRGTRTSTKPIGAREKDALAQLDLEHPCDKKTIKTQYRDLVKKYHPDVNRGNKRAEETFKRITQAYHHLLEHYVDRQS